MQKLFLQIIESQGASINVVKAMNELKLVGLQIQLAYAYSKGFPSSLCVFEILNNYQVHLKESGSILKGFVKSCIIALKLHKLIWDAAQKGKTDLIVSAIQKLEELSKEMIEKSETFIQQMQKLSSLSHNAIVTATKDEVNSNKEKDSVLKLVDKQSEVRSKFESKDCRVRGRHSRFHVRYPEKNLSTMQL